MQEMVRGAQVHSGQRLAGCGGFVAQLDRRGTTKTAEKRLNIGREVVEQSIEQSVTAVGGLVGLRPPPACVLRTRRARATAGRGADKSTEAQRER